MTFWASDLFKAKNGKSLNPGFTVRYPVVRQVSKDDYETYRDYGKQLGYSTLGFLIIGFIFANRM